MLAYCQENPVNFQDAAGTRMVHADPYRGGPLPDKEQKSAEQKVLDARIFTMYKGIPVVKLPIGTDAFSFGIIFLGNDVGKRSDSIETVRHEYGHAKHFLMAGPESYLVNAFLPSVISYWFFNLEYGEYYSQPYEYIADVLGQVNRVDVTTNQPYKYSDTTKKWAGLYFKYTVSFRY